MASEQQSDRPAGDKRRRTSSRKIAGQMHAPEGPFSPRATRKRRRAPNAGGKSRWMRGFLERPDLPLWKGIADNFWF
jgi:hypothetical protein